MAIAALSTAGLSQYVAASSNVSASQQAWQALEQNLASGNLSAAQAALNRYGALNQNLSALGGSSSASNSSSNSQLETDMKALGSAISSGDVPTAQSAFATVQNDLKSTPSQAVTNAEAAVSQTVQWVDDLLNISSSSSTMPAPVDPTTAILNAAYRQNSGTNGTSATSTDSNSTAPTTSILDSAYGGDTAAASTGTSSSAITTGTSGTEAANAYAANSSEASAVSSVNDGIGASVNVYA